MNIILFGFKSAGKTYWGKILACQLAIPFVDLDDLIAAHYHKPVREIYRDLGESGFRKIEKEILQNLTITNSVIALGGGTVLDPENVKLLQTMGEMFYLKVGFETIQSRIEGTPAFVNAENSLKLIYDARIPIYEAIAAQWINNE